VANHPALSVECTEYRTFQFRGGMEELSLSFEPVVWTPVLLAAGVVTAVLLLRVYQTRIAHLPTWAQRTLITLRILGWLVLLLLLFRPRLQYSEADQRQLLFAIVGDRSRSMSVRDGPAGLSRREQMLQTLAECRTELEAVGKLAEVRQFDFDADLQAIKERTVETPGEMTAIGVTLDSVLKQLADRKAEVLLLSDGAQRALPPRDLDPRESARRLADYEVKVHTSTFGAGGLSDSVLDLAVEELNVPPMVFVKNNVIVQTRIRMTGAAGREVTVRVLLEDHASRSRGDPNTMRQVAPPVRVRTSQPQAVMPVELQFKAETAGEYRLAVEAVPLDGEPLIANNVLQTYITVQQGGVSVALFDRELHVEQKFIRRVNESPDVQLDFKPIRVRPGEREADLDADWFDPGRYDVFIIGDVPARFINREYLNRIARRVEDGAGLLMYGGASSFGPGGYGGSPLAEALPVEVRPEEVASNEELDPRFHLLEPTPMLPTDQHQSHFITRLDDPSQNVQRWRSLPPLDGVNRLGRPKPVALVLAASPGNMPLLVVQDYGRGRSAAFAGDTSYRWFLAGKKDEHQRFWQQLILWLAHKDIQGDSAVWLRLEGRRYRPGQTVNMTFGARDKDKQPITDAEFTVTIEGPQPGQTRTASPQRAAQDFTAAVNDITTPGEYTVRVEAKKDGVAVGLSAQARFLVFEVDLELANPAADAGLMEELANATGGEAIPPEQLRDFFKRRLKEGNLRPDIRKLSSVTLWDNWWVLLVFTTLMTIEWIVRKSHGLV
jgi:hypothetical protein